MYYIKLIVIYKEISTPSAYSNTTAVILVVWRYIIYCNCSHFFSKKAIKKYLR